MGSLPIFIYSKAITNVIQVVDHRYSARYPKELLRSVRRKGSFKKLK
jgi:hypothetical protein